VVSCLRAVELTLGGHRRDPDSDLSHALRGVECPLV
jgi:hypothetical protein